MHICIWWCFQAEFKVGSLQITRKVTTVYYRMTTGILTEDGELQPRLPQSRVTFLYWDIVFYWPLDILLQDQTLILLMPTFLQQKYCNPQGLRPVTAVSCGTSAASNCTQEYGWMRGFNSAVLVGAFHQTSKFRWHQLVHFNYPLILSALNAAHARPGGNGLS